ncbi:MAG: hypothetical protein AMJ54_08600 [Deltaproteobacteria bacterium SG8_13]|nr:MAG: hypothetical protein AMJ54_08600 [Deltaproteobacteria bacterium SG8_13]
MDNFLLIISCTMILVPLLLSILNKKYFYLSVIILYPLVGQFIRLKIDLVLFTINPSMLFGLLVLFLTLLDVVLRPIKHLQLEIAIIVFITLALLTSVFSPIRFESFSWSLKITSWLLIFIGASKTFSSKEDLILVNFAVTIAALIVIFSFALARLGFYGESIDYETGVKLYSGGFQSGKTFGYYLAMAVPTLAILLVNKSGVLKVFSLFIILLALGVVALTFVRAPVIALLIGFLAFQYFSWKYDKKSSRQLIGSVALVCLTILVVVFFFKDSEYTSRWKTLGDKYTEGKIEKLGSGRVGGLMGFYEYYVYKASPLRKMIGSGIGSSFIFLEQEKYIHNDFAEIMLGCGIVGFFLYFYILYKVLRLLLQAINKVPDQEMKKYIILSLAQLFMFLAFHMTNITSGVIIISVWAVNTGAVLSIGYAAVDDARNHVTARTENNSLA